MNKSKRLFFQIILWLVIWFLLNFAQNLELQFITESICVFSLQIMLIVFVIYFAAPVFLFKKKYPAFFFVSAAVIVLIALISDFFVLKPPPPPDFFSKEKSHLSPPIWVHLSQSLLFIITYFSTLFIENIWFMHQKEKEILLIKSEAVESKLKLLKSQINPHFLFNTLNNIYALTEIDTQKTRSSISYLSDMLRYVLYECEQPFVPLQKEVKYLQDYIELFSMKSSRKYPIEMQIQIMDNNTQIAPMMLIPFVENAIKHSSVEKSRTAFIRILIDATREKIIFETENSLPATNINKDETGGIGLENVRKRLQILYPKKHELRITETANTYKVRLTVKTTDYA